MSSLIVPEKLNTPHAEHSPIWHVIKQRKVLAFLAVCFLMLCSHGPYYTFYTIYLEEQGYSSYMIGILWAVGVLAEVIIFLLMQLGWATYFQFIGLFLVRQYAERCDAQ